ncbi:MAG: cation-translocating P-type ATPase [Anaerolineae bacterium]|nr:cation-translocating P-type ATPase [Anaerolineae bacterium]
MLSSPPPYQLAAEEVVLALDSDRQRGLNAEQVHERLVEFGPNALQATPPPTPLDIFLAQFKEPLVLVLVAATLVSAGVWFLERGQPGAEPLPYDSLVILAIVILNSVLGVVQEYRAEQSVRALRRLTAPEAKVVRGGERQRIPADQIVPGDLLILEAGDRVPSDARLLEAMNLQVDESALTGESVPVSKSVAALEGEHPLGDRVNMVYTGSAATYGRGLALATATGMATEMGAIAGLIQRADPSDTPLQRELARVGGQLGILVLVISVIVFVTGVVARGATSFEAMLAMFLFAVALAVAAIPEGLPAIVTVALAIGVRRMADRRAIVRKLPAVETLGSATVICTDKTGTLTRNEMAVRELLVGVSHRYVVSGEGYIPEGALTPLDIPAHPSDLAWTLSVGALCNDAEVVAVDGAWRADGDPTEAALLVLAMKAGLRQEMLAQAEPRVGEIPFSSERKLMTTIHSLAVGQAATGLVADLDLGRVNDGLVANIKGAPDVVLRACRWVRDQGTVRELTADDRACIRQVNEELGEQALRTLGLAYRELEANDPSVDYEPQVVEHELVFLGLVGIIDPPRLEAPTAVAEAKRAGIRPIMITGDHATTALAIARAIGLAQPGDRVLSGADLNKLDDAGLDQAVREVSVYARVDPAHKLRIVEALQRQGHIVAMTGDGVNDAPALKRADIGVAMGLRGTDVAKEAADMVLTDDNFATIVAAIGEGRAIFDNIRKFIRYLLSSNAGEVLTMFLGIMLAGGLGFISPAGVAFLPILTAQILWINLVTDGAPALALGVDPRTPDIMLQPPRALNEPVIPRRMWIFIGLVGVVMMVGTLGILEAYYPGGLLTLFQPPTDAAHTADFARTVAFTTLMLFQCFNALNSRSGRQSIFRLGFFGNRWLWGAIALSVGLHALVIYVPALQAAFETLPMRPVDWLVSVLVASSVLIVVEIAKVLGWLER